MVQNNQQGLMALEFTAPTHSQNPINNLRRSLGVNVQQTHEHYLAEFLRMNADGDLGQNIHLTNQKFLDGELKYSTLRLYKSAYLFGIALLIALQEGYELPDFINAQDEKSLSDMAHHHNLDTLNTCYQVVLNWQPENAIRQKVMDLSSELLHRSSAHRSKYFNPKLLQRLQQFKRKGLKFTNLFLPLNCVLGLRPHEWHSAKLIKVTDGHLTAYTQEQLNQLEKLDIKPDTTNCHYWLKVKNSKYNPNDFNLKRACGEYRYLGLDPLGVAFIKDCHAFIQFIHGACPNPDKFVRYLKQQNRNLSYVLKKDPICQEILRQDFEYQFTLFQENLKLHQDDPNRQAFLQAGKKVFGERPTYYSTRHQAIANAKASGFDPLVIASLFGHISSITAQRHYGKKHHGSRILCPQVSSYNLAIVADHLLNSHENVLQRQEKVLYEQQKVYEQMHQAQLVAKDLSDLFSDNINDLTPPKPPTP